MCQFQQFRFPSSDGSSSCYAGAWLPPEEPRGVVQIVHGVGEHIGRYETAARFPTRQGFLVCGEDHLGHGNTVQTAATAPLPPERVEAGSGRHRPTAPHPGGEASGRPLLPPGPLHGLFPHPDLPHRPSGDGGRSHPVGDRAGARPPGGFRKLLAGLVPAGV